MEEFSREVRSPDRPVTGRLGAFTGLSFVTSAIPIPFVPARALKLLRGALAHEVASRHGLSLSSDARRILAEPGTTSRVRNAVRKGVEMTARRLLRGLSLAPLSSSATAFEVFALGHVLDRYFRELRPRGAGCPRGTGGTVRVDGAEALHIRALVDAASRRAASRAVKPRPLSRAEPIEDLRDGFTRFWDNIILGAATLPSYLERRLDAALDEAVAGELELRRV